MSFSSPSPVGSFDVVALGSAIVDIVQRVDDAFLERNGIAKGTATLIDAARLAALLDLMEEKSLSSGGSAANASAGLSSLGCRCGLICRLGDDDPGRRFIADMEDLGVVVRASPSSSGEGTGCCCVFVTPDGERSMCAFLGINARFDAATLDAEMIRAAGWMLVEGYLWDSPTAREAVFAAAEIARKAGTRIAIGLSDALCVGRHRDSMRDFVENFAALTFANEAEFTAFHGDVDFATATAMASSARGGGFAVTRSEKGCVAILDGETTTIPTTPTSPLDATGAGDAFAAGFLAGRISGASPELCGRLGNHAAAAVLGMSGARAPSSALEDLRRRWLDA